VSQGATNIARAGRSGVWQPILVRTVKLLFHLGCGTLGLSHDEEVEVGERQSLAEIGELDPGVAPQIVPKNRALSVLGMAWPARSIASTNYSRMRGLSASSNILSAMSANSPGAPPRRIWPIRPHSR